MHVEGPLHARETNPRPVLKGALKILTKLLHRISTHSAWHQNLAWHFQPLTSRGQTNCDLLAGITKPENTETPKQLFQFFTFFFLEHWNSQGSKMNSPDADPVEKFSASAKRIGSVWPVVRVSMRKLGTNLSLVSVFRCFDSLFRGFVISCPLFTHVFPRFELDQCICLALWLVVFNIGICCEWPKSLLWFQFYRSNWNKLMHHWASKESSQITSKPWQFSDQKNSLHTCWRADPR